MDNTRDFDVDDALHGLVASRDRLLAATGGCSERQWTCKPSTSAWCAAEIVEHLALLEELFNARLVPILREAPPPPEERDVISLDHRIRELADREASTMGHAPGPLVPRGAWSAAESLRRFAVARELTIQYLTSTPDLRAHVRDHPIAGPLDAYQWILFIAAHTERHTRQLVEAVATEGTRSEITAL